MDDSETPRPVMLRRGYESVERVPGGRPSQRVGAGPAHAVEAVGDQSRMSLCGKFMVLVEGAWPPGSFERGCPACGEAAARYEQG